jgi:hypothetical protein
MFKIFLLFLTVASASCLGQTWVGKQTIINPLVTRAASCTAPSGKTIMELNNVRALIHTGGNLWQIPSQNTCMYEVPKNSGIMALFTSALWLGGTDINDQLKLAALRYRDGQDYWTGPLTPGAATVIPEECKKYDKHFVTVKDDVKEFNSWYEAGLEDLANGTNLQNSLFPNYKIPLEIKNWPAHGDISLGQDYYLAPFFDRNNNGIYEWALGDYPWYDFTKSISCKVDRTVSLFGDQNFWWVMNDKGNIHTETNAEPIGMEIRSQAFAFTSNDQINNMTFYNYQLINRGTQTLYNTYFGIFVDAALGNPNNDYVGCDVNRGLAYVYNGTAVDSEGPAGFKGYGANPPAVGMDFFEGPYQDNDNLDNAFGIGENEALNGIGFGDGIVDNERFGMRRFMYYNNGSGGFNTDPQNATEYYKFLRGIWKDNTKIVYGGNGHISDPQANPTVPADFVFPGSTDTLGWGTGGLPQVPWTEQTAGNPPADRRFLQSAGPFILTPGAVNNITVGVCWSRSGQSDPFSSVESLLVADDKAQALFENCFKIIEGPNAPTMNAQELDKEIILTLSNPTNSNNYQELYEELDPGIASSNANADKTYNFQGYQIFQLANEQVSISELGDTDLARQVAQCDIKDNIDRIINHDFDAEINSSLPIEMVNGENKGIRHSFKITTDLFSSSTNKNLVNFKTYHYIAISYSHNEYEPYVPTDPNFLNGQKKRYLSSRKSAYGAVKFISATPHKSAPEMQGTLFSYAYGFSPEVTRLDGTGNGSRSLELTEDSEKSIVANGVLNEATYKAGAGPINIKVIDPLNVVGGYFECKFRTYANPTTENVSVKGIDTARFTIFHYASENGAFIDSIASENTIKVDNEQLIPYWGVSVQISQIQYTLNTGQLASSFRINRFAAPLSSAITFNDSTKRWLEPITDTDDNYPTNWILSGSTAVPATAPAIGYGDEGCYRDVLNKDNTQQYEKIWNGGLAPYSLVGHTCPYAPVQFPSFFVSYSTTFSRSTIARGSSIDIVFTSDKSLWTRCAVVELGTNPNFTIGSAEKGVLRKSLSVNKEGQPDGTGTYGLGWFPGYAIDIENGMRLQMAFGENSGLGIDNGSDMKWNPSSTLTQNLIPILGGQHPIYVFGVGIAGSACPYYQESNQWVYDNLALATNEGYLDAYSNLMWVANPILAQGQSILSCDARIKARIQKEYENKSFTNKNAAKPMYSWKMDDNALLTNNSDGLQAAMDLIGIVPNPYYAYSEYERDRLDTRVKLINLPSQCSVRIYNISGKLMKSFKKDNDLTYQDWNLQNSVGLPLATGTYLIHVEVPGGGSRILKFFLAARQFDSQGL